MEHTSEAAVHAHPNNTKVIWRTLIILSAITVVELFVGMAIAPHYHNLKIGFGVFYLICTLAKAFYIVAEFMHLGHELKNMIMTIVFPLLIFVWFIIAFLWDGNSYKNLREKHNKQLFVPAPKATENGGEHQSDGEHH